MISAFFLAIAVPIGAVLYLMYMFSQYPKMPSRDEPMDVIRLEDENENEDQKK